MPGTRNELVRLTTKRLVLALAGPRDAHAFRDYALRNVESHRPWSPPLPKNAFTLQTARQRIRAAHADFARQSRIALWLRRRRSPRGPFLGAITLSQIQLGAFRSATVGYHLDHECVGQGLMSEALHRVVRYAFDELQLHRLEGNFVPTNAVLVCSSARASRSRVMRANTCSSAAPGATTY